jgi:hypothetical protein
MNAVAVTHLKSIDVVFQFNDFGRSIWVTIEFGALPHKCRLKKYQIAIRNLSDHIPEVVAASICPSTLRTTVAEI